MSAACNYPHLWPAQGRLDLRLRAMLESGKITRSGGTSKGSAQKDTLLREASKALIRQGKMWVIASSHPGAERQAALLLHHRREGLLELATSLRGDDAPLEQHGAELVDQRRALAAQPVAHAVERLQVQPLLALQLDEAHRRARRRLGDRL